MAKRFGLTALTSLLISLGVALPAAAAEEKTDAGDSAPAEGDKADSDASGDKAKDGDADSKKEKDGAAVTPEDVHAEETSPVEDAGKTYKFVGARYRLIVVPEFILSMFASGGRTVAVHSGGPEIGIRKAGFEFNFSLWLSSYAMDPTPFKAKKDGEDAWELVESNIKVLYLTSDFLWSHEISPEVAINYGMGAGLGVVWGPLYRNQAMRSGGGFVKCPGPIGGVCGNDNNHYGNYQEPSWVDGGSKPIVFPWLALQTGLRYKPHRRFVARLDAGFGLSGFFFGLGADYGL